MAIQRIARFPLPLILRVNGRLKPSATVMGHIRILNSMTLLSGDTMIRAFNWDPEKQGL